MYSTFFKALNSIYALSEEAQSLILPLIETKSLKKDELILEHDEVCRSFYFIKSGFARIFYHKNGKEITEWFAPQETFCFSIISFFDETPSNLVIECLEDSEVVYFGKEGLDILVKQNLEIANLLMSMYAASLKLSQIRMDSIQFESAKQRYERLLELQPQILNKVPLHHIASYLGITAETLSRIRTQL
ncbi:Crp/Fnr family transcriptional regulator [Zhouia sp. PK063]|uniref:Crp/Fnr family transcriptional regulator n=1 Tax=Zhouia sp. PK063 TaxID=3373602 RepID=UPI00378B731C